MVGAVGGEVTVAVKTRVGEPPALLGNTRRKKKEKEIEK